VGKAEACVFADEYCTEKQRPMRSHQSKDAEGGLAGKYDIWGKELERMGGAARVEPSV
jgi:hypothetical protein